MTQRANAIYFGTYNHCYFWHDNTIFWDDDIYIKMIFYFISLEIPEIQLIVLCKTYTMMTNFAEFSKDVHVWFLYYYTLDKW